MVSRDDEATFKFLYDMVEKNEESMLLGSNKGSMDID